MQITRKILAGVLLTFFLGGMFVSLFHLIPPMGGEMDMSSGAPVGMSGCPFSSHEETVCPMNLMDHIGAWKDMFVAVVPGFLLLMAAASLLAVAVSLAPNLLKQQLYFIATYRKCIHARVDIFIHKFWQELFSNGILNPKLF